MPRTAAALIAPLMVAVLAGAAPAAPNPAALFVLLGDGLGRTVAGKPQPLRFGIAKAAAITAATAVLGKPQSSQTAPDCGQGRPMLLVTYKAGLTLQFLRGKFSGWSLEGHVDPRLKTAAGIAIGSTAAAVRKAYPDALIDDGSLGVMFTRGDGPSGFLDSMKPNARVTGLYAGETCMIS